ncbi:MAG: MFS transporter [Alphaproteobacteria bacterium]|nr:MAG: MFS transporter [Alphaproteobacteria bacterium]
MKKLVRAVDGTAILVCNYTRCSLIIFVQKKHFFPVLAAWISLNLFFLYMYAIRVSTGAMFAQLRTEFSMTGEQFGLFGSCYLYAYSLAQIPMGILLDRFGVRTISLFSVFLTLLAVFSLANVTSLNLAYVSRSLLGLGSAAVMMSCLKFTSDQLPIHLRGIFMGAGLSVGVVGALSAGMGVPELLKVMSWRVVLNNSLLIGAPIAFLLLTFVPKNLSNQEEKKANTPVFSGVGRHLKGVLTNPSIILYGCMSIGVYTPLATIADLWGTAFLSAKYGWDNALASQTIVQMYVGLILGAVLLPCVNRYINNINAMLRMAILGILILFCVILYIPGLSIGFLVGFLVTIGMLCGAEMMCFNGASQYATPQTSGLIIGIVNTFNMLGSGLLNQTIGKMLDMNWDGTMDNGLRVYSAENYTVALSVLVATSALCFMISFFLKSPSKK